MPLTTPPGRPAGCGGAAAAPCPSPRVVHTIGHSTREAAAFLALLTAHAIACVVDVRRWPASRRHPHFAREPLRAALAGAGLEYVWRQDLGGFRTPAPASPNTGWRVGTFRAYADFMLTPAFAAVMAELEELAGARRIALMCAEALPWRCHRQLLADAFTVRAWTVRHILDGGCAEHRLPPFAEPAGTRIVYPADGPAQRSEAGHLDLTGDIGTGAMDQTGDTGTGAMDPTSDSRRERWN